ncbi:MAG: DUF2780 domain-containing protein [Acidobacteriota bacterium]
MELIETLTQKLGVRFEQARNGAGLLFGTARLRLRKEDFSKVARVVPEIDEILRTAPQSLRTGVRFAGLGSAIGGDGSPANAGATLARGFSRLGMDTRITGDFVSLVLAYLRSRGGEEVGNLLENALK